MKKFSYRSNNKTTIYCNYTSNEAAVGGPCTIYEFCNEIITKFSKGVPAVSKKID